MGNVTEVTGKEQFDEAVQGSGKLIIADFWAERCGPCRMLGPVLHDLAEKHSDDIEVLKINVDESDNQELAQSFGVKSIPQVTFFKGGEQVDQFVGALPPDQVEEYITKYTSE